MRRLTERLNGFLRTDRGSQAAFVLVGLIVVVAVWHAVDFSHDFDPEFPGLQRDHHSPYAPFAYRLAEPGDTLDLTVLYLSAVGLGLLALGRLVKPAGPSEDFSPAHRVLLFGLCLVGLWIGAAPDPAADGWHGLSLISIARAGTPSATRLALAAIAVTVLALIAVPLAWRGKTLFREASPTWRMLSVVCAGCVVWRIVGQPDPEPWGYWPRWAMIVAMIIVDSALLGRLTARESAPGTQRNVAYRPIFVSVCLVFAVIQAGYYVHWLHWPISRLKVVVPGQLYCSAMPSPEGLAVAHARHGFKTIINLFNEDTPQRHRDYPAELAFAEANGIRYVRADGSSQGVDFVRKTLEIARDPQNWPVLVHCHGNMDRTPAWVGIYRFTDLKWSMREVLAAIERHRGYRPKGGVTILYDDVLPQLAPERWQDDTVARKLEEYGREYERIQNATAVAGKESETSRK